MLALAVVGLMLAVIIRQNTLLLNEAHKIMATLAEVNATLDSVADGVNALEAQIADLKAQVAAGSAVTQADLDALGEKAAGIAADIADTSDQG